MRGEVIAIRTAFIVEMSWEGSLVRGADQIAFRTADFSASLEALHRSEIRIRFEHLKKTCLLAIMFKPVRYIDTNTSLSPPCIPES